MGSSDTTSPPPSSDGASSSGGARDVTSSEVADVTSSEVADVINLTDETTDGYGRTELQTLNAVQLGTRYNLGVRYKF